MIMIPILARLSDPVDPSPVFPGGYLPFSFSSFLAESIEISVVRLQKTPPLAVAIAIYRYTTVMERLAPAPVHIDITWPLLPY